MYVCVCVCVCVEFHFFSRHFLLIVMLRGIIGYWHHNLVCPSVMLCVVALRVGVKG